MVRYRTFGGLTVSAGGKSFTQGADHRTQMAWDGAVEDLERTGFIRTGDPERQLFELTREGYLAADELERYEKDGPTE